MNIEIWYIILMATGLFAALMVGERIVRRRYRWIVWIILLLLFWNIPQSLKASADTQTGWHPITAEYHAEITTALSFINSNAIQEDVIVTTDYINVYDSLFPIAGLKNRNVIIYDPAAPNGNDIIYDVIDNYQAGWIVLDELRGSVMAQPVPLHDFDYNGKQVDFMGRFVDVFIFKWGN